MWRMFETFVPRQVTLSLSHGCTHEASLDRARQLMDKHTVRVFRSRYPGQRLAQLVLALAFIFVSVHGFAQTPDGHSEHHPAVAPNPAAPATPERPAAPSNPPAGNSSTSMPAMGSGQSGETGVGCMGGGCMGRPPKEFYPSLMALPSLSPEQRQHIEAQARNWISTGTDADRERRKFASSRQCRRRHSRRRASCVASARRPQSGEQRYGGAPGVS